MPFKNIFLESKIILTEGALVERLKAEFGAKMDNFINHAGLIYTKPEILEMLYRQYIDIAKKHQLPVMIMTPTRRVNFESLRESSFRDKNIIADTCLFLNSIKESYKDFSQNILIGGLMGCKGDAYSGKKVLSTEDSYIFHKLQAIQFQNNNTDYLFAGIMPEINETIGMAKAMAETKIPYIISFMIRKNGCLMDGTPLSKAIQLIDEQVYPNPVCYMANCIHPTNLLEALSNPKNKESAQLKRFCGIQANASILSPEELNNCEILQQDDFNNIVEEMYHLLQDFGLKIFGGCCGTNDKFLEILTKTMLVRGN